MNTTDTAGSTLSVGKELVKDVKSDFPAHFVGFVHARLALNDETDVDLAA
jgi:hypothetical protein